MEGLDDEAQRQAIIVVALYPPSFLFAIRVLDARLVLGLTTEAQPSSWPADDARQNARACHG